MFAGKSTELLVQAEKLCIPGVKEDALLMIKHSHDLQRTNNSYIIQTHNKRNMVCEVVSNLADVDKDKLAKAKHIFVDEAQFFSDLHSQVLLWVETMNKNVTLAGLDGDIHRKPFGHMLEMVPLADSVMKIPGFCAQCIVHDEHVPAFFSSWIKAEHSPVKVFTEENNPIVVGGGERYETLCRKCYLKNNPQ
jgi:thymidine kinase